MMPSKKEIERQRALSEFAALELPEHLSRMTQEEVAKANRDLSEIKKSWKREEGLRWATGAQVTNLIRRIAAPSLRAARLAAWGEKHAKLIDRDERELPAHLVATILLVEEQKARDAREKEARETGTPLAPEKKPRKPSTIVKDVQQARKLRKVRTG